MNEIRDRREKHWFWVDDAVIDAHATALGPFGLALYMVLARHADRQGHCYPSMRRLQALLGDASRNTIKKYLALLVSRGLLTYTRRQDDEGDAASHLYILLTVPSTLHKQPGDVTPIETEVSTIDRGGSTIDRGVGQPLTGGGSTIDPKGIGFKELGIEGRKPSPHPINGEQNNFDPNLGEQYSELLGEHNASRGHESSTAHNAKAWVESPCQAALPKNSRAHGTAPRQLAEKARQAEAQQQQAAIAACVHCDTIGTLLFFDAQQRGYTARCPHELPRILAYVARHAYTWPGAPPPDHGPAP